MPRRAVNGTADACRCESGLNEAVQWTADFASWSSEGVVVTPRPDLESGPDWERVEAPISMSDQPSWFERLSVGRVAL